MHVTMCVSYSQYLCIEQAIGKVAIHGFVQNSISHTSQENQDARHQVRPQHMY